MTEPTGTYNCPVCGWNEPHAEHATEQILRLGSEQAKLKARATDLTCALETIERLATDRVVRDIARDALSQAHGQAR